MRPPGTSVLEAKITKRLNEKIAALRQEIQRLNQLLSPDDGERVTNRISTDPMRVDGHEG